MTYIHVRKAIKLKQVPWTTLGRRRFVEDDADQRPSLLTVRLYCRIDLDESGCISISTYGVSVDNALPKGRAAVYQPKKLARDYI